MKIIAADIETAAAEELHYGFPGFIRLCGWADVAGGPVNVTTDVREFADVLLSADAVTFHNGINFDLMALAAQGWITFDQYVALCTRSVDTLLAVRHLDPVAAKGAQANGYYQLGQCATRYGLDGKDTVDFQGKLAIVRRVHGDKAADKMQAARERSKAANPPNEFGVLKLLAELYGGFDKIPQDDPDYNRYLVKDVEAQRGLFLAVQRDVAAQPRSSQRYLRREHYIGGALGRVTLEGARVDTDLNMKRFSEGQARLDDGKALLHEKYGMPLEGKKPHTTSAGKAAFKAALLGTGIADWALEANWPLNKDGSLSTSKDTLNAMVQTLSKAGNESAADLCRTILAMNGERTVYGTILEHTHGGKVHPYIGPDQASGRWSMKNPGLTVLGKRGGKARERAVILADSDDEVLVAIDADQVDARVIAAECQDPEYMKLFQPGMDLHSEVAFRVWPDMTRHGDGCHREAQAGCDCGVTAKCHCELRDRAKVFGHGFSYGLGANGMARQHGVDVSVAQGFIQGMTDAFPRLAAWKAEVRDAAGAVGFDEEVPPNDSYRILHTWAGRPVRVERDRAYTQATALIGQGGTRDVMAEAILRLPPGIRRRVRAVIHDEIVISLPKDGAQEAAQRIADGMAFDLVAYEGAVPVRITFGCSRVDPCWAGTYGTSYCDHAKAA